MATFFYDRYSNENNLSQWTKHLQTEEYINDFNGIISYNRRELESTIQNATSEQTKVFSRVFGSLDKVNRHLEEINSNISELRSEVSAMASMLDWRLSIMIEEQRLTNQLLGHITQLLRIPDSQKQRVYYIEQGLKYLKNGILEGIDSSFYIDAMEGFKEAEKIEAKDYITLNRIGQIYLYSKKYMDFSLAETYFIKSAREAFVESNAGGTTTSNHLNPFGQQSVHNHFRVATVEAYLYASRACYLQQKLSEAIELAGKAFKLMPEFLDAGFEQAKYLAANNQQNEAIKNLKIVIDKDRYFSVKTFLDKDLNTKQPVLNLLEDFRVKAIESAKKEYNDCISIVNPKSKAIVILKDIELEISQNTFLSGMKALDLLNKEYELPSILYSKGEYECIDKRIVTLPVKLKAYINSENAAPKNLEYLKSEVVKEKSEENKIVGVFFGAIAGFVIGFFKGCSLSEMSMNWLTLIITIVICGAIGGLFGFISGQFANTSTRDKNY